MNSKLVSMNILVTGGTGYIGSHTVVALTQAGYQPVIIDNLSNSKVLVLERIARITGRRPIFYEQDATDVKRVSHIVKKHDIEAIIHFAGYKSVSESVEKPLDYYDNNLNSLLSVCRSAEYHGVKSVIFSSSATVYGDPEEVPIKETHRLEAVNPYGQTKLMGEQILRDFAAAYSVTGVTILRYFNPIGAHPSGLIGEDPSGIPANLLPFVTQVATGKRKSLQIFGSDYPTPDGTGVRDYIHVQDLAAGHVAALRNSSKRIATYNLGTGQGYSVLEVVKAFEKVNGVRIPYKLADRRPGDVAECYADPSLAYQKLGWKATRSLEEMCHDAWNWQHSNPNGYV